MALLEVLVVPLRNGRHDLVNQYEELFYDSKGLHVVQYDLEIAREAARLRAKFNFRTTDAIQLATALHQGADVSVTNDRELTRVTDLKRSCLIEDPGSLRCLPRRRPRTKSCRCNCPYQC